MARDGLPPHDEQAPIASRAALDTAWSRMWPAPLEGNGVMSQTTGSGPTRMRLAFYGRTNHLGEKAGTDVSRQYRACRATAAEFGAMTQSFHDAPHALDSHFCHNVRHVESRLGTPRGDCQKLATRIADPDREFDAIVCAALDRLPRQPRLRHPLLRAASTAYAPFVFASDDLSLTGQLASNALIFSRLGLLCPQWPEPSMTREPDHASADASVRTWPGGADG